MESSRYKEQVEETFHFLPEGRDSQLSGPWYLPGRLRYLVEVGDDLATYKLEDMNKDFVG